MRFKMNIKTKEEARNYAIEKQQQISQSRLSYAEIVKIQNELVKIGVKFRLIREFKREGLL